MTTPTPPASWRCWQDHQPCDSAKHGALQASPATQPTRRLDTGLLLPPGLQWYWRGQFFDQITDDAIDIHLEYGSINPTALSTMHLYPVDGAAHRVGADDAAWSYRDAEWSGVFGGIDPDPGQRRADKEWSAGYVTS